MNELKIGDLLFLLPHPGSKEYILGWVVGPRIITNANHVVYTVQWCDMLEPTYEGPKGTLKCRERFLEYQKTLGVTP